MEIKHIPIFSTVILIVSLVLGSCQNKEQVDLILLSGKVYTVDQNMNQVEALAVKDGKFIAVGSNEQINNAYMATQTLDLEGRPVYPGFIDGHCHFFGLGLQEQEADLGGTKSFDELLGRLQEFAKNNTSKFVIGRGWDQNDWEDTSYPTKDALDTLFPETP